MKIVKLRINNFRGIKESHLLLPGHTVLVGDNNTGKSTILEAIDLVLGPERLSRRPIIDEHDFYRGQYLDNEKNPIDILVEAIIIDLSIDQQRHFRNHLEWWDTVENLLIKGPPPEATDRDGVVAALRLRFKGNYDAEEDDFVGATFFMSPEKEDGTYDIFGTRDKRLCGFLYLRTLRTGTRALSLERGSLLDIILRLKELRPQMWENVLEQLRRVSVASDPDIGISDVLESVQTAVRSLVPIECADAPTMRVSQLTREHLRQILTVFLGTGSLCDDGAEYAAPFHHQGTGTINTLVLSLLSMIAELKQNVIFAMEEPEIAIPPHTQKRIINSIISKSAQAIFTSHSPYVLEEFDPSHIVVVNRNNGILTGTPAQYPPTVKQKMYREEVKRRFCESLLARRVLIAEGKTEYDAFPVAAKRLHELFPDEYTSLEGLGIAMINAETDSQVAPLGDYFRKLGKTVFAVFDKQSEESRTNIIAVIDHAFEAPEKGFENVVVNGSSETALRRYAIFLIDNPSLA
ncbi:AAA family ATPase [Pelotomaculum propionicicum]|uniref:DNA replication and repair protein RecF n=1 Tax=Pelotomaculum propionicicum TaxID=258475 RepID=A0A4Y7RKV3_9FIRM|nr:AAA family ATPase [Pelotomaculum propionicicum]TEB09605.1 DNA replication and repair protein RecF [Pelotomaculum propionicicum]